MNTVFDPSHLKPGVVSDRTEVSVLEALIILDARDRYLFGPPARLDFVFLLDLHQAMFGNVLQWAGVVRRTMTNFGMEPHLVEAAPSNYPGGSFGGKRCR